MLKKQIIGLLESYATASNSHLDHFDLHNNKLRYKDEIGTDFNSFFEKLKDVADYAQFDFQIRVATEIEFLHILKMLDFPIIAFHEGTTDIKPILIKHNSSEKCIDVSFDIEHPQDTQSFIHMDAVLNSVKRYGSLNADNLLFLNQENTIEESDKSKVIFLTGFKITNSIKVELGQKPTPMQRLIHLLKSEKKDVYTVYLFAIMIALVNLTLPLGIQALVGLMSGGLLLESVFVLMVMVIFATAMAGWLQVRQLSIVEILQQRLFAKTAFDFAYRIPKLKLESMNNHYMPELINRFFDVLTVQKSLPKILVDFTSAIIQILFGLLLLSFYHPYFILFGLLVLSSIILVFYFTSKKGLETSIYESKYKYQVVYWLEELGRSIQSFKLAGLVGLPIKKIDKLLEKYISFRKKHFGILVTQYSAIIAFKTIITAGLLILGGALVFQEQINLGQFVASEIIIVLVINSVEKLIGTISVVYDMLTALDKIGQITDVELENNSGTEVSYLNIDEEFKLELINVSYKFPEARDYSFRNVNLVINKGEKICITGYNDSGKTTLLQTVAGLFHLYEGVIKLNGISIRELNIGSYRGIIGDNLNLSDVYEGTIEENITMGRSGILLKDIIHSIHLAGLEVFVAGLKNGLQSQVQPEGKNFPSNIVKRILLARSFVLNPSLIVIDEFFHNVQSQEKITLLRNLFAGSYAMLIVSIIPEVMERCDKIVVMNEGTIIDQGTYSELELRKSLPFA
jgi:ABC-type bacteriocin/lantibiotic exporter with double-glycine peptidase domain